MDANGAERMDSEDDPVELALKEEFRSYLAQITTVFAEPVKNGIEQQERELLQRLESAKNEIDAYATQVSEQVLKLAQVCASQERLLRTIESDQGKLSKTVDYLRQSLIKKVSLVNSMEKHQEKLTRTIGRLTWFTVTAVALAFVILLLHHQS
jgi:flagellar hook-associated protein FlgK